jgi:hypothetical protein
MNRKDPEMNSKERSPTEPEIRNSKSETRNKSESRNGETTMIQKILAVRDVSCVRAPVAAPAAPAFRIAFLACVCFDNIEFSA